MIEENLAIPVLSADGERIKGAEYIDPGTDPRTNPGTDPGTDANPGTETNRGTYANFTKTCPSGPTVPSATSTNASSAGANTTPNVIEKTGFATTCDYCATTTSNSSY